MHRTKFMLMPKATFKSALLILISLPILLTSCSDSGAKKDQQLKEATTLTASGQYDAALELLNLIAASSPNDPVILLKMSEVYAAQGDATAQAFILQQVQALRPDDVELLYQTYLAHKKSNQNTAPWLEKIVTVSPDTMTADMWLELGALRAQAGQTQAALDAYLKGVNADSPSPENATAIGQLFLQLENSAQAERWFTVAADSDEPSALTALFGLLQIHLSNKNWPAAENTVEQLNTQFPGAIEASQWADETAELKRWRQAQDALQAQLKKKEEEAKAAEAKAKAEAEAAAAAVAKAAEEAKKTAETVERVTETADAKVEEDKPSGKTQVIADLEAAEAMATAPALEVEPEAEEPSNEPTGTKTVAYDPSIAIQPADPDFNVEVDFDQEANGAVVDYNTNVSTPELLPEEPTVELIEAPSASVETTFSTPPSNIAIDDRDIEAILTEAGTAEMERDYERAIRLYWQALGKENDRADIWNLLSRAYLVQNETKNAETTALEAIRFAPREVNYTLDYLRIIQRTKKPSDFLAELETAYDRFPRSPEIALSLARAYERISQNTTSAYALYERFIELAPGHPLREEAEAAMDRLR